MRLTLVTNRVVSLIAWPIFFCIWASETLSQPASINALSLQSGVHARILSPTDSKYVLITVRATSPDSLRYSLKGATDTKALTWESINKMDASVGSRHHFGRGVLVGLLVGSLSGAILGAASGPGQDMTKGQDAAIGAVIFGFFGAIGGGVVGLVWRTEKWIPVTMPRSPVGFGRSHE